jgi:hypothetical protein
VLGFVIPVEPLTEKFVNIVFPEVGELYGSTTKLYPYPVIGIGEVVGVGVGVNVDAGVDDGVDSGVTDGVGVTVTLGVTDGVGVGVLKITNISSQYVGS